MCTEVSSGTGSPSPLHQPLSPAVSPAVSPQEGSKLTLGRDTEISVRFTFCSHHIQNTGQLFPHHERMRTTRRRQVIEDASEPMCGRRMLDSIKMTRGDDTREDEGRATNQTNLWSVPRSQPRASGPSPDSTKFGTSGSTQTRPKRMMTMTHSFKKSSTSGPASVSDGVMRLRQRREYGKVVRAVGSEEFQDTREDSKSRTVHGQHRKREVTKFQAA